ncbi:MAG TPA: sulfur oxidation c-type cytochrome SoxX [Burkholderiaceae bacterium]|jgi:sulfur-oxidizing protein SoxX|nr:sulfur oxidation c-type cytochrome SoxX [Burkholderiaceae bacterium]
MNHFVSLPAGVRRVLPQVLPAGTAALMLAGCASFSTGPSDEQVAQVLKASFSERGPAKLDRLDQTPLQKACSLPVGTELSKPVREELERAAIATVKYPADGKFLGSWAEGERIAQNGRGLQFTDSSSAPNGANCYACHQLAPAELSFGNIGPSLYQYGKLRGSSDAVLKYTWAKIYNSHAFNACSQMPRYGDAGILTQQQLQHVMALLLDPASPVNK